jgi:hypothetical protein
MKKMVYDDKFVINLEGLAWVRKYDWRCDTSEAFYLECKHTGADGCFEYKSKKERDALFQKVIDAIEKQDEKAL